MEVAELRVMWWWFAQAQMTQNSDHAVTSTANVRLMTFLAM